MKSYLAGICLAFVFGACGGPAPQEPAAETAPAALPTPATFKTSFQAGLEAYFDLKDALVQTDAALASEKAKSLAEAVHGVDAEGLSAEAALLWEMAGQDVLAAAGDIASEPDVDVQRERFERLSAAMIDMVKSYGPFSGTVYVQRCPMVRGGSADWLSKEEQVMNPYHGSRMLHCGSVITRV